MVPFGAGLRYGEARHAILLRDPKTIAKIVIAIEVLYNTAIACVKLSCLLLYRRVFPSRTFHITLYAIGGFIFVYSWVITISVIFQCSPARASWDVSVPNAQCIDFNVEAVVFAALNAATNIITVCLPMPMLWRPKLPSESQIQLMGVFLVGAFVCIVSIYRIPQVTKMSRVDAPWSDVDTCVWSMVEVCVGIVGACLPTYRPLFEYLWGEDVRPFRHLGRRNNISWPTSRNHSRNEMPRAAQKVEMIEQSLNVRDDGDSVRSDERRRRAPELDLEKPLPPLVPWHGDEESETGSLQRGAPSRYWL
ncbi:MAG: hypothetical protein Q9191_000014 [Dirinaria sp. TL-2023a]